MNLMWMAGIFALVFAERSWKHGLVLAKVFGVGLMVLGGLIIARPALLPIVSV
jgi:predicted metal-binding membrane protein